MIGRIIALIIVGLIVGALGRLSTPDAIRWASGSPS
jgi:hypothetical protein